MSGRSFCSYRFSRSFALCLFLLSFLPTQIALAVDNADIEFSHEMIFGNLPGLPSTVDIHLKSDRIDIVRLVVVIDDSLFLIPLRRTSDSDFSGTFPSPRERIRYSFQFVSEGERTSMSKSFVRKQSCIASPDLGADARSRLLERANELDTESEQLLFLNRALDEMKEQP